MVLDHSKILLKKITAGENPYEGENAETTSAKFVARLVSKNIPNLHQDTLITIDGKQKYMLIYYLAF